MDAGLLGLGAAALLSGGLAAAYFVRQHRAGRHDREVDGVLDGLGVEVLREVVLPDGVDGLAFIDALLLTPRGIVVLDIEHRQGRLFGGVSVDRWTQVIDGRTRKFDNPLYTLPHLCQAVSWNAGDIDIQGWVVFSRAGEFQRGVPEGCCMIDALPARIAPLLPPGAEIPAPLRAAWERLRDISVTQRAGLGR